MVITIIANHHTIISIPVNIWQDKLDQSISIKDIYIPGSHDSLAYNIALSYIRQTQYLSMKQQLNAGVRFFDVRLFDTTLACTHVMSSCRDKWFRTIYYKDVLRSASEFVKNTNEFVILYVSQEVMKTSQELFTKVVKQENKKFNCYDLDINMNVADARGKVLVLIRNEQELSRQDKFKSINLLNKCKCFEMASKDNRVVLNASNVWIWPELNSFVVNRCITKTIKNSTVPQWYMLDYITPKITQLIIDKNFE